MNTSSLKGRGRLSATAEEPCGWNKPVLRAISVKLVSRPSTISALEDAPSSCTRPRIPIEELRIPHLRRWNPDRRKAILENTELDPVDKVWLDYYKYVYEDEYGDAYEDMHATAIRSYCKANNVPLILATIKNKRKSKLVYDIYCGDVPRHSKGHPTKEGHAIHAKQMIDFYESTLLTKHK